MDNNLSFLQDLLVNYLEISLLSQSYSKLNKMSCFIWQILRIIFVTDSCGEYDFDDYGLIFFGKIFLPIFKLFQESQYTPKSEIKKFLFETSQRNLID